MANKGILKQLQEELSPNGGEVNQLGGLHTDSSLVNQPQGTTRFVMTGVNETTEGDNGLIANEESNAPCYTLPVGYIPMGQVYIGEQETFLLLAHPNGDSILAILDRESTLTIVFDDSEQEEKLGLSISQQIDATFRLRRGCDRVVYWVDPKPRTFTIEKPEDFKVDGGTEWDISKFNHFKTYQKIPKVLDIKVLDGAGALPPGSYNFSVQYLDQDFNPTEFAFSTETINIYNSAQSSAYREIRGSTKEVNAYLNYSNTNKAIRIDFDPDTFDTSYPFYRIAITEANSGNGLISDTKFTAEISTKNSTFIYTGLNFASSGSQAEVTMFNNVIDSATSIEQIENRLVLGNVKGKQINYCAFQKYASKITSDLITRPLVLSSLVEGNPKDPSVHIHETGYMPGEIYSFGIVYILEGNILSPVYHIPGKSSTVSNTKVYSPGTNVYPMSNIENACLDTQYLDNNACNTGAYWGKDCEGQDLTDEPVRHHRFPLRTDFGIPFISKITNTSETNYVKRIKVEMSGNASGIDLPTVCEAEGTLGYDAACVETFFPPFTLEVGYVQDTIAHSYDNLIDPQDWALGYNESTVGLVINKTFTSSVLVGTSVTLDSAQFIERDETGAATVLTGTTVGGVFTSVTSPKGLVYKISFIDGVEEYGEELIASEMFGIKFSNIVVPENVGDTKVIGYYIVRNERKQEDKTILDSAVLTSTITNKNFVSHGLLFPALADNSTVKKDVVSFISPEHKFNGINATNFTSVKQQGKFSANKTIKSRTKINDVAPGSGYVSGKHKKGENDSDGFSLQIKTRDTYTDFTPSTNFTLDGNLDIKQVFYLDALEDKIIKDSTEASVDVFNLTSDNKIGIMSLKQVLGEPVVNSLPYVYLCQDNSNPYSNFRLAPYYKESKNPVYFADAGSSTSEIFNGDSYITSMKYVNSVFYDNRMKQRAGKTNAWKFIAGIILLVAAVALQIFPVVGTAAGIALASVGAALVGGATALVLSGIKQASWNKAYSQLYKEGLKETIIDGYMQDDIDPVSFQSRGFKKNPSDDEIQWLGEAANLWFESSVNMGLRHGATDNTPDFVDAPAHLELGTTYPEWNREYFDIHSVGSETVPATTALDFHMVKKLTTLDAEKKDGRTYIGLALAEMYLLNPDYLRRNKQKTFNHLGLEYDCCSDCMEEFPHRWHWSEQSFQEELTDNFRTFLPNNYKDLEGESGAITDIFRIQNNLYIHTEEGLWHCPQTFQERVTSDIISFIGTGEYFSVPPRKIVDDKNSSAGNRNKWGRTKTKFGVLFPAYKEKKWYLFDGQNLKPISDNGMFSHFKEAMPSAVSEQYFLTNKKEYPYFNNPSHPAGVGFISTYDTVKERFIVTKKDFKLPVVPTEPFEISYDGENIVILTGITAIINARILAGWTYVGIEGTQLKFEKSMETTETITEEVITYHPPVDVSTVVPGCSPYISTVEINIFGTNEAGPIAYDYGYFSCSGEDVKLGAGTISHGEADTVIINMESCGEWYFNGDGQIMAENFVPSLNCDTTVVTTIPGYNTTATVTHEVTTETLITEYETPTTTILSNKLNTSWTMSYSLKREEWVSAQPYLPSFYFHVQERFYSWLQGSTSIYKHNIKGSYQTFYGTYYPFIVEYVDNSNPLQNKVWDHVLFQSEAKKFIPGTGEYIDQRNVTFNKVLMYNTQQISGVLNLVPKQNESIDYLIQQTKNVGSTTGSITIDRNERDWTFNDLRDLRVDYTVPMFYKDVSYLQSSYYIDKIVNPAAINVNKDWTQLESFRDKFLVIRLIFDTFADTRLIFNFSVTDKKVSER